MTDEEIVKRAKDAEKRTGFGELVHSPISKGINSAYGIGFIEGMVEYRNSMQKENVSDDFENVVIKLWNELNTGHEYSVIESYNVFYGLCLDIANWNKEQIIKRLCNHANIDQMVEKFEDKYKPKTVFDTDYYKRGIFDTINAIKKD